MNFSDGEYRVRYGRGFLVYGGDRLFVYGGCLDLKVVV